MCLQDVVNVVTTKAANLCFQRTLSEAKDERIRTQSRHMSGGSSDAPNDDGLTAEAKMILSCRPT